MNALIRLTREDDTPALPDIERSSGEAFRVVPELAWIADDDVQSVAAHLEFVRCGLSWVAVDDRDRPLGFLCAEISDGALHIWQLAVLHERQGFGLGRALIAAAIAHARGRSLGEVTLTTFRELAWNECFYRKLGFLTLGEEGLDARLAQILAKEATYGLPAERRCAMRLSLNDGQQDAGNDA
ncbi:GNAT family N-acetyltransferase [Ensifer sp. 4252]|uniref:GNAT family N-acetyltransferase n=1 Tax=Ensifer sp. 4252 TaxID=3373915 RepID=UPI003D234453